jgi:hypothetical protein
MRLQAEKGNSDSDNSDQGAVDISGYVLAAGNWDCGWCWGDGEGGVRAASASASAGTGAITDTAAGAGTIAGASIDGSDGGGCLCAVGQGRCGEQESE